MVDKLPFPQLVSLPDFWTIQTVSADLMVENCKVGPY